MSKNSITLDNFAEWQGEVDGVGIISNMPLEPYVPSGEINVNLGRVARAARMGHLGLVLFGKHAQKDSVSAGVDSVGDDGSATAAFSASASRAPRIQTDSVTPGDPLINKGVGVVSVNFGHHELDEINLREAKPWAKHIDLSVKEGLRACGKNKLFSPTTPRVLALGLTVGISSVIVNAFGASPENIATLYVANVLGYNGVRKALNGEVEATLIPFLPYDRIGAVQAYTRTRKFVETK